MHMLITLICLALAILTLAGICHWQAIRDAEHDEDWY